MLQEPDVYEQLKDRVGEIHLRQRLNVQIDRASNVFGQGRTLFHVENVEWLMVFIYYFLKCFGLYSIALRNARSPGVVENEVKIPGLPKELEGLRLLHLSDLHFDLDEGIVEAVIDAVKPIEADVCLLTGDYRTSTSGPYELAVTQVSRLVEALKVPVYGVLGNHDFIEFVPPLEKAGMRFLLNESSVIERGGARLHISGVDDPHFYETDNLEKAASGLPPGEPAVLLAHSPEIFRQAAACGYDLYLCGHTHGGQICLPGGHAVLTNARCPRDFKAGVWRYQMMQGYTSRGAGSCGVPARFFCPPEITVHILRSV